MDFISVLLDIKTFLFNLKRNILHTNSVEYYKTYYDEGLTKNPDWQIDKPRSWQLALLKKFGLKSNNNLLEYGFGLIIGSEYIIEYLDKDKFVGVEISEKVVQEAKRRVKMKKLAEKNPVFLHLDFPSFDCLKNMTFDFVWSAAVMSHIPPESLKIIFTELKKLIHKETKIYFDFNYSEKTKKISYKSWGYNWEFFENLGDELGYKVTRINESVKLDNREKLEPITCVKLELK